MLRNLLFLLFSLLFCYQSCFAAISNTSASFQTVLASIKVVAIAQVEKGDVANAFFAGRDEQSDVSVVLSFKEDLKGSSPDTFSFNPHKELNLRYYGGVPFPVKQGDYFLVLLNQNEKGWKLPAQSASFVPLVQGADLLTDKSLTLTQNVEQLLAKGCEKESFRFVSVFLLSQFDSAFAMKSLLPYIYDENDYIADAALSCFARNQQVSAIPLIIERSSNPDFGDISVPLLSRYYVKEAKSFLEKGLFGFPSGVRLNCAIAITGLADKNSVPFLLLGMFDQDPQEFVAPYSCSILHQILPEVPDQFDADQFKEQSTHEQQLFFSWWQDELSGKHPANPDEKPAVELRQAQRFTAADLPQLNQGLFMRSEITRRAAMRGLQQFADQTSIPYLLIALYDPQPEIAFDAYTLLHRLVPDLGAATAGQWRTERAAQIKVAFDWWQQHLLDTEKK